jgi:glutamate synthase domain-containing protein 2
MVVELASIRTKISDTKENREECHCPLCPSYPHQCDGEILFCGIDVSHCDIEAQGCLCNTCPVFFENELKSLYYCNQIGTGESNTFMRKRKSLEDPSFYQTVVDIKEESISNESLIVSMGSLKKLPFSLDDIQFIPAQVNKIPLNREEHVNTTVNLGPNAKKPLKLSSPIMISGLSFGAVSKNVKLVIAKTSSKLNIGFNTGEGGLTSEEKIEGLNCRIVQYSTGRFGIDEDILKSAAAVEIRFGQGAYPGKGSYLPSEKMTSEVARIRGLESGEAAYSPAHHYDMTSQQDIKDKVSYLREITHGAPVGAKIGCGDVKADIKVLVDSNIDYIALDGFGGGTGATDLYVRDNVGIPIFAALPQAHKTLTELGVKDNISLIASGGLLRSADFAKCLALGADAVYIGTAALIAINCQQYRICYTGLCPTGVTTQNPQLMKQLNIKEGVNRLTNFIELSTEEIANLTRIVGKDDVHKLDKNDIISLNKDLSSICRIRWLNGEYLQ